MPLKIERLTINDLDDVHNIELEVFPEPWSRQQFENELESSISVYFKAVSQGELVGYMGVLFIVDEAHLTTIGVAPEWQGKGIGKALLCKALLTAIDRGAAVMTLEVRVSNDTARKLYRRFGFSIVGQRKGYYAKIGEDAYIMDSPYLQGETYLRRIEGIGCKRAHTD